MKIQIVSDLHLEFWGLKKSYNFVKPTGDILCILGDLCCCDDAGYKIIASFFKEISPKYKFIFWIPGNHEYYMDKEVGIACTIPIINKKNISICALFPNIKYLNCKTESFQVKNTIYNFIGCPFWTNIPAKVGNKVEQSMNDFNKIYIWDRKIRAPKNISYKYVNAWHKKCKKFIITELAKSKKIEKSKKVKVKNIVLTHHKPFISKTREDVVNFAYESDQMGLLNTNLIKLWGYGHTHECLSLKKIGKTLLYSNPKGYPYQHTKFNKSECLNLSKM